MPVAPVVRYRTEPIFEGNALMIPGATVCVPTETGNRPLPVLYALDGDYFVESLHLCDLVARLAAEHAIAPWVVVSVGSTDRRTELLARRPEDLARAIVEELEPLVTEHVALSHVRSERAVLGYSYGGLAAVRFALARPNDFGRVIAMSPSLWFAGRSTLAAFRASSAALPERLYVDAGAREGDPGEVIPYMIDDARTLVGIARSRGMTFGRDVALREVPRMTHDMALAASRLPGALRFTLGSVALDATAPLDVSIDVFERAPPRSITTFSIDARYSPEVVLSWPIDLANVRLDGSATDTARVRSGHATLTASIAGVAATSVVDGSDARAD
jgi:predicted alpha/beta superfamily hydrolase